MTPITMGRGFAMLPVGLWAQSVCFGLPPDRVNRKRRSAPRKLLQTENRLTQARRQKKSLKDCARRTNSSPVVSKYPPSRRDYGTSDRRSTGNRVEADHW